MTHIKKYIFYIFIWLFISPKVNGQCIVINEIMVNALSSNSDGTGPNAGEWTELYNNCNTPIDISCWAFGDAQEFIAFIPPGTIIPPGGFYVIGSSNSGVSVDLNLGSCNCVFANTTIPAGLEIGVFTNGNEQAVLLDDLGNFVDGVIWGGGQTPMNASGVPPNGSCPTATFNVSGVSDFPLNNQLPGQNASSEGCTMSRTCDGSSTWIQTCPPNITAGASNGIPPTISFSSNQQNLCVGDCIDFTPVFTGTITNWNWNFIGSNTLNSSNQNPTNICYPTTGQFDVSVTVNSTCGTNSSTLSNYITVNPNITPIVSPSPGLSVCQGQTITLATTVGFLNYQWNLNGAPITGETSPTLIATSSGSYSVSCSNANTCISTSSPINLIISSISPPTITTDQTAICLGQTANITSPVGFNQYQLFNLGINVQTNSTGIFGINAAGTYSVEVSDANGCTALSNTIIINNSNINNVITANGPTSFCDGLTVELSAPLGYSSYQWYLDGNILPFETNPSIFAGISGVYECEIFDGNCSAISNSIVVDVLLTQLPSLETANGQYTFCAGIPFQFLCSTPGNLQWYFNNTLIPGETSANLFVTQPGDYSVSLTDVNNCVTFSTATVTSVPSPTPVIIEGSNIAYCLGQVLQINLDQNYPNVEWYLNGNLISGETNSNLTIQSQGIYYAVVTNANGCSNATSNIGITANIPPTPILNGPQPYTLCPGSLVTFNTNPGFVSYNWQNNSNSISISNVETYTASSGGLYSVIVTDANGCTGLSNTLTILNSAPALLNITSSTGVFYYCPNSPITLNANPFGIIQNDWEKNGIPISGSSNLQYIIADTPGWYKVYGTNSDNCKFTDSVEVLQYTIFQPILSSPRNALCEEGSPIKITVNQIGIQYDWYRNGSLTPSNQQNFYNTNLTGGYYLIITYSNGCTANSNTLNFTEAPKPVFEIIATPKDEACYGDNILLKTNLNQSNALWSNGLMQSEIFIFEEGTYTATITDDIGCKSTESIFIKFNPRPMVDAGPDDISTCYKNAIINANAQGNFFWMQNGELLNQNKLSFEYQEKEDAVLILTSELNGCTSSDTAFIKYNPCNAFFVPNSFTPNGDSKNDLFKAFSTNISKLSFRIFNRFGEQIFYTTDPNDAWDGTYKGEPCEMGSYVWIIEAYDEKGNFLNSGKSSNGVVTLVR